MTKVAKIVLADEVNALVTGLDPSTKADLDKRLTYFVPTAPFTPSYKLGVWDGKIHLFKDGWTYINLIDEDFINILIRRGYEVDVIDQRNSETIHFEDIDEDWVRGIKLRDYQIAAVNTTNKHSNGILLMATGAGKAQPLDAFVQTPTGPVPIGSIQIGDKILTIGSRVTTVTGVFPQGVKNVVKVKFGDGREVECCEEHLWSTFQCDWQPRTNRQFRTIDTKTVRAHLNSSKRYLYVPLCGHTFGYSSDLPLHPYLLGALIGDGGMSQQTICFSSADEFLVDRISALLPDGMVLKKRGRYDHRLINKTKSRSIKNPIRESLKSLGLYGLTSVSKFVPDMYKRSSTDDRLDLIRGLFDTDGTVAKNGSITFCTISRRLADDVRAILWSLGAVCKISERSPSYSHNGEKKRGAKAYVLSVRHPTPEVLFSLPRKRDRILAKPYQYGGDVLKLRIVDVEDVGQKECVCISVADPSQLYLTNDYVVTHNTNICAGITKAFVPHGKVITVVPRVDLVASTSGAYINGGIADVGVFYGQEKHVAEATVTTWQSLVAKPEILSGCACLILDEAHLYSAKEMFTLLGGPAAKIHHRYGFTGTLPKEQINKQQLLAAIGPVIFSKAAYELQQEGYLSSCHIHVMETQEAIDPLNQMVTVGRAFVDHEQEFNWLLKDPGRLDWMAETIRTIASTGNTLVLMRLKHTSDELQKRISEAIQVDGRMGSSDRTDIYNAVNQGNNAILLATKGVASTGIDITHIYNVVMIEAGKSFTEVIQMIGRGLRKGGEKAHVDVWDICANTQFSRKHARERKKFYAENKYPFNVIKVTRQTAKEMFG